MKYLPSHYALALYQALLGKEGNAQAATLRRFAGIVRKNGDGKHLNTILARYEKIYLEKNGLKKIEVESANPLSPAVRAEIERAGSGTGGDKKVLLEEKVKPELLAGIKLLVNDTLLIDASGMTRIAKLFSH